MTSHSFNDFSVPIKPPKSTYKKQIARRQKRFNFAKIHIAHSYEACSVSEKYSKVCFLSYFSSRKYFLVDPFSQRIFYGNIVEFFQIGILLQQIL